MIASLLVGINATARRAPSECSFFRTERCIHHPECTESLRVIRLRAGRLPPFPHGPGKRIPRLFSIALHLRDHSGTPGLWKRKALDFTGVTRQCRQGPIGRVSITLAQRRDRAIDARCWRPLWDLSQRSSGCVSQWLEVGSPLNFHHRSLRQNRRILRSKHERAVQNPGHFRITTQAFVGQGYLLKDEISCADPD